VRLPDPPEPPDPRVVKALSHPLRVRILSILGARVASPTQLAEETGEPLGNVSYHVRTLAGLGLIELVSTVPRRGVLEHRYRAVEVGPDGPADA
jgi:DNA-binding transcriptional ArsR family regulator